MMWRFLIGVTLLIVSNVFCQYLEASVDEVVSGSSEGGGGIIHDLQKNEKHNNSPKSDVNNGRHNTENPSNNEIKQTTDRVKPQQRRRRKKSKTTEAAIVNSDKVESITEIGSAPVMTDLLGEVKTNSMTHLHYKGLERSGNKPVNEKEESTEKHINADDENNNNTVPPPNTLSEGRSDTEDNDKENASNVRNGMYHQNYSPAENNIEKINRKEDRESILQLNIPKPMPPFFFNPNDHKLLIYKNKWVPGLKYRNIMNVREANQMSNMLPYGRNNLYDSFTRTVQDQESDPMTTSFQIASKESIAPAKLDRNNFNFIFPNNPGLEIKLPKIDDFKINDRNDYPLSLPRTPNDVIMDNNIFNQLASAPLPAQRLTQPAPIFMQPLQNYYQTNGYYDYSQLRKSDY